METYGWVNLVLWGTATFIIAYLFMDKIQSAAADIKQQQELSEAETIRELYLNIDPEIFFFFRASVAGLLFLVGTALINSFLGLLLAAFGFFVPATMLKNMRIKRIKKFESQLVEGLEMMGNGLKSGLTLQQSIELLCREFPAPISQEFRRVLAENRLGVDLVDALQHMADRMESTITSILVSGVAITKRCGGDLTQIFSNIATTIREQANIEGKLDAVTAQGRFQGLILSIMPFALIVILWFVDRSHVETLFGYQVGIWAVAGVCVMVFMAQMWIRRLLKIDV
ncbi:MAG: type II secretion system F family protein [Bdellovibrionales bacterium]|nr:type II secretion system F family protein [Bdellovibrionales bacterium]